MTEAIALFLGNGVSNFSQGYSWNDLLISLCKKYKVDLNIIENIPLTLLYENIFFKSGVSFKKENSRLKKIIADKIGKIKHNDFHKAFVQIDNVTDIITTNYDFNFEFSSGLTKSEIANSAVKAQESKYSLYRYFELSSHKRIWHIHGHINSLDSIMLGYEHYIGQIEKIRKVVTKSKDENWINESWINSFLNKTLIVLGFGLDYSEIDVWWLLSYRRRGKHYTKPYKNLSNRIVLIISGFEYQKRRSFYDILRNFEIELKIYDVKSYYELYQRSISDIDGGLV